MYTKHKNIWKGKSQALSGVQDQTLVACKMPTWYCPSGILKFQGFHGTIDILICLIKKKYHEALGAILGQPW